MRLFIVIEETAFYHPHFLSKFLRLCRDQVVGVALVTRVPDKHNIEKYMMRHWYYLKFGELCRLGWQKYYYRLMDLLPRQRSSRRFYSVRSVLKAFDLDYFTVQDNINRPEYLAAIEQAQADVIISSNSLIFGKTLLSLPKYCCINRHSALLPSYGGLWPVFQAYRSGETSTGVSVHTMEAAIDKGVVLARQELALKDDDIIARLYQQCFDISADVLLAALDKIRVQDYSAVETRGQASYYSFPDRSHWQAFRQRGGRFA